MGYYTFYEIDILNPENVYMAEMLKAFKILLIESQDNEKFYEYGGDLFNYRPRDFNEFINDIQAVFNVDKKYKIIKNLFSKKKSSLFLIRCEKLLRIDNAIKWYNHEDHMRWLSLKTPNIVWGLSGEGEEKDDLWKKYFKAGKMQEARAKIKYDDYNEDKLI